MAKGKTLKGKNAKSKEQGELQKLKQENQKLKRQLNRLRKQIARVDLDDFNNVKEALEAQAREDEAYSQLEEKKKLIDKWRCFDCGTDYLRLIIIQRPDGDFYFRKCPTCLNRTKMKPFSDSVKGPEG